MACMSVARAVHVIGTTYSKTVVPFIRLRNMRFLLRKDAPCKFDFQVPRNSTSAKKQHRKLDEDLLLQIMKINIYIWHPWRHLLFLLFAFNIFWCELLRCGCLVFLAVFPRVCPGFFTKGRFRQGIHPILSCKKWGQGVECPATGKIKRKGEKNYKYFFVMIFKTRKEELSDWFIISKRQLGCFGIPEIRFMGGY